MDSACAGLREAHASGVNPAIMAQSGASMAISGPGSNQEEIGRDSAENGKVGGDGVLLSLSLEAFVSPASGRNDARSITTARVGNSECHPAGSDLQMPHRVSESSRRAPIG